MEGNNIEYITPEEVRKLDPSQIASMTMHSGVVFYVTHGEEIQENEFRVEEMANQNSYQTYGNQFSKLEQKEVMKTCKFCGNNYKSSQTNNQPTENPVLRAKKENKEEKETGEGKAEEAVEIEVEAQPEGSEKKDVLRGPDGKPLLMDIITGGNFGYEQPPQLKPQGEEIQPQNEEYLNQQNYYPTQQEQNTQQYNVQEQEINQTGEQQYVQEQNEEMNNNEYQEQYYNQEKYEQNQNQESNTYPQEQDQNFYPPQEVGDKNVQEQYAEPNIPNQSYEEGYVNVPEGYENQNNQYYDQNQGQENMYPNFEDDNNQFQQQVYTPNEVPPQNQEYYPENKSQIQPQPIYHPETQPQMQSQPEYYPETKPQIQNQSEYYPGNQPKIQQPIEPTYEQPIQPQTQVQPTIQPTQSTQPGIQPIPIQPPITDGKRQVPQKPKKPVVQIKFGFGLPKIELPGLPRRRVPQQALMPHGPHGRFGSHNPSQFQGAKRFVLPKQQRRLGPGVNKIFMNSVGNIMNAVQEAMAPIASLAVKRMGLRSTKPKTNKIAKENEQQKEPILRARPKEIANYSSYYQQAQFLCPECASEEYNNMYGYSQTYKGMNKTGNKGNYTSQTFQNKHKIGTNNFNFHEIVETSDNSKSRVVVKKGGIIVSDK